MTGHNNKEVQIQVEEEDVFIAAIAIALISPLVEIVSEAHVITIEVIEPRPPSANKKPIYKNGNG